MSVGLLLITHGDIGEALLTTACRMFGVCPLAADAMAVRNEADAEQLRNDARRRVEALNCGDGVLVLTDGVWRIVQYNLTFPIPNDLAKEFSEKIREYESREPATE